MLRGIRNRHIKPRIVPFQLTTAATPSATMNIGGGDWTVTRTSAGNGVLTLKRPFARNGLFFATQSVANGYYTALDATTGSGSQFDYAILDNSGNGADGSCEGFAFGWDSSDISVCQKQQVVGTVDRPRIIWGKISSAGVVNIGTSDFSCTNTATGTYAITFKRAFAATPVVMVNAINATTALTPCLSSKSATGVTVTLADRTPTLTDNAFYIMVGGSDCNVDTWDKRTPIENSQRKVQIVGAEVTNTTGAWTGTINSNDFGTITDNAAGDFSMTVASTTANFAREMAVFAQTTVHQAQIGAVATSGLVRVQCRNFIGNLDDDDGVTWVVAIGSEDACEY